ncbi:citrate lyase acyl carrier protein [Melissococcus plutonius]|uniref:Citrate lyase acyl carrier protein n=2 Tax=Melissococcus plutonius TaxID=33970 RepID=F3YCY4_MELPT|nr:citrate lyase acyl carrier protein [Melissococcus plutonius]BAL62957.1 citrate lyase acyl carrier protein [Melissococcus plutonius DAT561]AIM26019.1 citrate lyase acyl carrier protein CitD [Melissococcus plutonius S1]KMT23404.1 citrate lyase acyl carrier protein CitD [Melissococcus plutonius]KMT23554.1 citrate lyase acyl carrier protein CitD [Melissococcus plutonius]KMT28068.1 citrate lyase acyl carrier protein CitD [Melissococcus plutonius]
MEIKRTAVAGTLESSDIQIILSENKQRGIQLEIKSQVIEQFGEQIERVIREVLKDYTITDAKVKVVDKGALDCVIKARLTTAIHRSLGIENSETPWEVNK